MSRKTKTPKALSIFRKLYAYLGATGFSTLLIGKWGITEKDMLLILELYMYGGVFIQVVCDAYFFKEDSVPKFKPEKNEIKP